MRLPRQGGAIFFVVGGGVAIKHPRLRCEFNRVYFYQIGDGLKHFLRLRKRQFKLKESAHNNVGVGIPNPGSYFLCFLY